MKLQTRQVRMRRMIWIRTNTITEATTAIRSEYVLLSLSLSLPLSQTNTQTNKQDGGFGDDDDDPFGDGGGDEDEEDGDGEDNVAIDLENSYYEADDLYGQGDLDDALKKYEHVVEIEADPKNKDILENMSDGPWSFKSLSKIVLIHTMQGSTQKLLES